MWGKTWWQSKKTSFNRTVLWIYGSGMWCNIVLQMQIITREVLHFHGWRIREFNPPMMVSLWHFSRWDGPLQNRSVSECHRTGWTVGTDLMRFDRANPGSRPTFPREARWPIRLSIKISSLLPGDCLVDRFNIVKIYSWSRPRVNLMNLSYVMQWTPWTPFHHTSAHLIELYHHCDRGLLDHHRRVWEVMDSPFRT
jgi:hypothetical protein